MPTDWGAVQAQQEREWVAKQDAAFRASGLGICTHKPYCKEGQTGPIRLGRRDEPVTRPGGAR